MRRLKVSAEDAAALVERRPLLITLGLPHKALSPNSRAHWRTVAAQKRALRTEAGWAAKVVLGQQNWPPPAKSATVRPVFYWPDRRKRDQDNATASLKAAYDGLQDAGVVADDAAFRHQEPLFRIDRKHPRVELEVTLQEA